MSKVRKENRIIAALLVVLFITVMFYLGGAIINSSFDFTKWNDSKEIIGSFYILASIGGGLLTFFAYED